mmetsp:Transcript_26625/g.39222  ORF Transcript_26625/g.39222 Transcript_26625/m.39222 type:complete len:247 (+) Transcript_26625:194-934(+)
MRTNEEACDYGRGIMYHCRMLYLRSEDDSRRGKRRNIGGIGESSSNSSSSNEKPQFSFMSSAHEPCPQERLIPPNEVMTRAQSFRYAYWKHNPPAASVPRMECLQKKEEPNVKKKREEIFSRIKTAEVALERARREKEARKRAERMMGGGQGGGGAGGGGSGSVGGGITGTKTFDSDLEHGEKDTVSRWDNVGDTWANTGGPIGSDKGRAENETESGSDKDEYPEGFSFLSTWKKQKSYRWKSDRQ